MWRTADGEPIHPEYGTLKDVLADLGSEVRLDGPLGLSEYLVRLMWFRDRYRELAHTNEAVSS
jgi:hypothetical protein